MSRGTARTFWGIAFGLYVLVALVAAVGAVGSAGSMAMMLTVPVLLTLGAPWGVALLVIAGYMLRELPAHEQNQLGSFTLLGVPFLGVLLNGWLLWLQFRRSAPQEETQGAEAVPGPLPTSRKIWWAIAVPGALFLCFGYVMDIWGARAGHPASYRFSFDRVVPLAQAIVLVNCWVLFLDWRRRGALALAALALPFLVAAEMSQSLFPEWSWRLLGPIWTALGYVMVPGRAVSWGFWVWLPIVVLLCVASVKAPALVRSWARR